MEFLRGYQYDKRHLKKVTEYSNQNEYSSLQCAENNNYMA